MLILKMLNKVDDDDLSFLTDENAINYIKNMQDQIEDTGTSTSKLQELFEDIDPELFQLLQGLLEFNPYYRLTAA